MNAEADALAQEAQQAEQLANATLSQFTTIGQLWIALAQLSVMAQPGYRHPSAQKARAMREEASGMAAQARQLLAQSCDPQLTRQKAELCEQRDRLKEAMRSRDRVLNVDEAIAREEEALAWLAKGQLPPGWTNLELHNVSEEYRIQRRKLTDLRVALQKPAAVAGNQRDQ